jgi:hypothetical protein
MRRIHNGLTITAVVEDSKLTALRQLLQQINVQDEQGRSLIDFSAMPSLLFSSIVIAEAAPDAQGRMLPNRLLVFTSYSGTKKKHIKELVDHGRKGWIQLFAHCKGYVDQQGEAQGNVSRLLRKHIIRNTYYTGSHFISRQDQEQEHQLQKAIQEFLDEKWQDPTFVDAKPAEVRKEIQEFVASKDALSWSLAPYRLILSDWLALYGSLLLVGVLMFFSLVAPIVSVVLNGPAMAVYLAIGIGLVLQLVWPLLKKSLPRELDESKVVAKEEEKVFSWKKWLIRLIVFLLLTSSLTATLWNAVDHYAHWPWSGVLFWGFVFLMITLLLLLRRDERIPSEPIEPIPDERVSAITEKEYHPVVNEMSVISTLKKGSIRPLFLSLTLRLVPLIRAFNYIPSVHTARWLQTDNGRRLVFIAYFDNTSEGYAHDFVDSTKRTRNLNLIFGHAQGFPPTRYAILDGGKDRRQYMLGVRKSQLLTAVWYNSHPELSITNVNRNRAIRKGLFGKLKEEEIPEWLAQL